MQLYIIRHGQSTNNILADMRNRTFDPVLTDLGHRQTELVAQYLAEGIRIEQRWGDLDEDTSAQRRTGAGITRLYCSAMYRALQTAQPIGQVLGLNPEVWVDIHESGGIFLEHEDERGTIGYPGKTRSEILAEFPNYVLPDTVAEHGWWDVNKGREDLFTCQGRAIRVGHHLQQCAHTNERIALVSHGGFIDALIKAVTSQLPGDHLFYHHFNTAISRIDFDGTGRLDVRYINRTDHLAPELIS